MRVRTRLLALPIIAALAAIPSSLSSIADDSAPSDRASKAVTWISAQTNGSGTLSSFEDRPDLGLTFDAVLASLAAGSYASIDGWLDSVEPLFTARVLENPELGTKRDNGLLAKGLVTLAAAGRDTSNYGGIDLAALTADSLLTPNEPGWAKGTNAFGQAYVMIGLARTGTLPPATVQFVAGKQCPNGGFPMFFTAGSGCADDAKADTDGTAMLIMALRAAEAEGITAAEAPLAKAVTWLKNVQRPNGSYSSYVPSGSAPIENTNTTGIVAAAMANLEPTTVTRAQSWVSGLQLTTGGNAGAVAYGQSAFNTGLKTPEENGGKAPASLGTWIRSTTQAVLAFAPVDLYRLQRVEPTPTPSATPGTPSATRTPSPAPTKVPVFDVYSTPGYHTINGRRWHTTCEPYSQTTRCRTEITATVIKSQPDGSFKAVTDWAFNNLTYQPAPLSLWKGNPLATPGNHTIAGRQWKTECNTAATGRNGCRSYLLTSYIANSAPAGEPAKYEWKQGFVFNNILRYTS